MAIACRMPRWENSVQKSRELGTTDFCSDALVGEILELGEVGSGDRQERKLQRAAALIPI